MKQIIPLNAIFFIIVQGCLFGDVKGLLDIKFDANNDAQYEAVLNSQGFGLGMVSPSANLHVLGNAIFSENLSVGTNFKTSTFNLSGTISQLNETVSSNQTLSNSSMIFADTSLGNISLQLPTASSTTNRRYFIKKTSPLNSLHLKGNFIDCFSEIVFGANSDIFPFIELIGGSGNQWYVTNMSGNTGAVHSSNLLAWYALDETSGNTANNSTSYNLSGIITNIATGNIGVTGKIANAISFDGIDDGIMVLDNEDVLDSIKTELSVCFWVKDESPGVASGYISKEINASTGWAIEDGRFFIWASGSNSDNSYNDIDDNQWHHMAYTWDGTTSKVYKDGALFDSLVTGAGTISANNDPLILAHTKLSGNTEREFNGKLDDVRVYNKSLSATEIHLIYSASR